MSKSVRRQCGLATVEMALVTPVLLIILLVTFEFTRAFYQQNTLTKAVRDATRLIANNGYKGDFYKVTDEDIEDAKNLAVYGNIAGSGSPVITGLTTAHFTYNEPPGLPVGQEHVQMSVSYPFRPVWSPIRGMTFLNGDVGTEFTLRAISTMRALK